MNCIDRWHGTNPWNLEWIFCTLTISRDFLLLLRFMMFFVPKILFFRNCFGMIHASESEFVLQLLPLARCCTCNRTTRANVMHTVAILIFLSSCSKLIFCCGMWSKCMAIKALKYLGFVFFAIWFCRLLLAMHFNQDNLKSKY